MAPDRRALVPHTVLLFYIIHLRNEMINIRHCLVNYADILRVKFYFLFFQYPIQGPFRTRLCMYLQGSFYTVFLEMLDNVVYIQSLQDMDVGKMFY